MSAEQIVVPPPIVSPTNPTRYTLEEYFAMDAASERPLEYFDGIVTPKDGVEVTPDGEVRAMSGSTPPHNRIALNVSIQIDRAFEDRECEVYMDDIRTRVSPGQYRYPDVVAVCGPAQFDKGNPPALLNPMVVIEVLSPSTQNVDRGEKADEYRNLPTLTDYVLVAQHRVFVTHYARRGAMQWVFTDYTALTDTLTLTSIDVTLTLADIYRKIVFLPAASAE